jgi:hippurate hydrolase
LSLRHDAGSSQGNTIEGQTVTGILDSETRERLVALRRDLHRHPELSWQEVRTANKVCEALDRLGIRYRAGIAETGVIAEIPGRRGPPYVALRADMDALPIQEETGLEFASANDGVMHACGHDGHTTMVLGAAELLARDGDLPVTVRLIFQPAEETGAGAKAMMEAGALDDVAMIFGGHVDRHYPTGAIVTHPGAVNASTDSFVMRIRGHGGHAARPHEAVDAVVVGSLLVMAIQTIVSREVNPAHPSVVTVGRFDAGTAHNVIAGRAVLEGTIRAQDPSVREHLIRSLRRIAESVGRLHVAEITVEVNEGTPALVNPTDMAELARLAASGVVGPENAVPLHTPNMGGEDFAYYMEKVPGCYVRLGAQAAGREGFPAHSSKFDFDENVLPIGSEYFYRVAKLAGERLTGA